MNTKEDLISDLISRGFLKTPSIIKAFKKIDRADFVVEEFKKNAYLNEPLSIGHNQTISQPLTVAFMIERLEPKSGDKILDIGAGSGWQTSLLASVVGKKGKVIALERILPLKALAEENVEKYGFIKKGIAQVIWGNAISGYAEEAPYDKIISAASAEEIPKEWINELKVGGRLVAPVKDSIILIKKVSEAKIERKEYEGFRFVPLVAE